jgi:Asp-tRNA(Asn)/Glu-tRNA(Gln) amidotransferase B subunit
MRQKADNVDYRFFCEPNIISLDINYLIAEAVASMKESPLTIKKQLLDSNVPLSIVDQLLDDYEAYRAFNYVNTRIHNPSLAVT